MPRIAWDDRLSLGIEEIDDQHRRLIGHANRLLEAVDKGLADGIISDLIHDLREYTVFHFRDEEAYMVRVAYPELAVHCQAHEDLRRRVKDLQRQLYEHRLPAPATVRELLRTWLVEHILHMDRKIGDWVRERRAAGREGADQA